MGSSQMRVSDKKRPAFDIGQRHESRDVTNVDSGPVLSRTVRLKDRSTTSCLGSDSDAIARTRVHSGVC
jgi:hypothetical protein